MKLDKTHRAITDRIVAMLDAGVCPWRNPMMGGGTLQSPIAFETSAHYRGINVLVLMAAQAQHGFETSNWLSFKAAKRLGGSVRKGEHATGFVVRYNAVFDRKDGKIVRDSHGEPVVRYMAPRYTPVFNVAQCDGLKGVPEPAKPVTEGTTDECPADAAALISGAEASGNMPTIGHGQRGRAYYRPSTDAINVPAVETFASAEEYASTCFHEMGHATGHESRLAREAITKGDASFGNHAYGREELVAEMTAAFLCAQTGIATATIENSAAYLGHWVKTIKGEPKMVLQAASAAQKAVDFINQAAASAGAREAA